MESVQSQTMVSVLIAWLYKEQVEKDSVILRWKAVSTSCKELSGFQLGKLFLSLPCSVPSFMATRWNPGLKKVQFLCLVL